MEYDSADNLYRWVQPGRENTTENRYTNWYGDTDAQRAKHLLLRSRTPEYVIDYYAYDEHGNRTNARRLDVRAADDSSSETQYPFIRTERSYTFSGNYVAQEKDSFGRITAKSFDEMSGNLLSVTTPNEQTLNYTYDSSNNLSNVQMTMNGMTYKNEYEYVNDKIVSLSHNTSGDDCDAMYAFDYDDLGRQQNVRCGDTALMTNVYVDKRSDLLKEVSYANGGKISYAYDDFDRLQAISFDDEDFRRYEYEYGANGRIASIKDNALGRMIYSEYDLADRACRCTTKDNDTNQMIYRCEMLYNKQANLAQFRESMIDQNELTQIAYDRDNKVVEMQYGEGRKITYAYDELGRVASRTIENGNTPYMMNYAFAVGGYGDNSTSSVVSSISQIGMNYSYTYDSSNNVTTVNCNGMNTRYSYDGIGQLIRVDDSKDGFTWTYSYDRGGNILSKCKYPYSTGILGTPLETKVFSYTDTNWKDKLTSYDGRAITYDAIGNPLNDGTWTYTWAAGRQLHKWKKLGR